MRLPRKQQIQPRRRNDVNTSGLSWCRKKIDAEHRFQKKIGEGIETCLEVDVFGRHRALHLFKGVDARSRVRRATSNDCRVRLNGERLCPEASWRHTEADERKAGIRAYGG